MKVIDIIFALVCGRLIGFLLGDFLKEWGIHLGWYSFLILWILLPFFSLLCLWIAYLIGRKFSFIFQGAKFLLVGAFTTIFDLKIFEFLVWLFAPIPLVSKGISFLAVIFFRYYGNKYWTFGKSFGDAQDSCEKENIKMEIIQFLIITLIGLIINVSSFHYFIKIMGPQFSIPVVIWIKLSVIFAAITAALWNFLGYKFLVFKK